MKTPDFFALSDREQEERRPDGAQKKDLNQSLGRIL
jgi:hypothetical protein